MSHQTGERSIGGLLPPVAAADWNLPGNISQYAKKPPGFFNRSTVETYYGSIYEIMKEKPVLTNPHNIPQPVLNCPLLQPLSG